MEFEIQIPTAVGIQNSAILLVSASPVTTAQAKACMSGASRRKFKSWFLTAICLCGFQPGSGWLFRGRRERATAGRSSAATCQSWGCHPPGNASSVSLQSTRCQTNCSHSTAKRRAETACLYPIGIQHWATIGAFHARAARAYSTQPEDHALPVAQAASFPSTKALTRHATETRLRLVNPGS